MHCYQHQELVSIGICKSCQKAVCSKCAIDTDCGLVCSDTCANDVKELKQILDHSKQVYSIGRKSNMPATDVLFNIFFAITLGGYGLYPLILDMQPDWFVVILGSGFLVFGIIGHIRTRKLQLNC